MTFILGGNQYTLSAEHYVRKVGTLQVVFRDCLSVCELRWCSMEALSHSTLFSQTFSIKSLSTVKVTFKIGFFLSFVFMEVSAVCFLALKRNNNYYSYLHYKLEHRP